MRTRLALFAAALACAAVLSPRSPASAQGVNRRDDMSGASNSYQVPEIAAPSVPNMIPMQSLQRRASMNYCPWSSWTDSRGTLALQPTGEDPGACVFKSDVKSRQCNCSTYLWRDVHLGNINKDVNNPSFSYTDYEEPVNGSQCISYRYTYSVTDNGNGNYSPVVTPYCP